MGRHDQQNKGDVMEENDKEYYAVNSDGIMSVSQDWVDGAEYERETIVNILESVLENIKANNMENLSPTAVLGILFTAIQSRTDETNG
jgi:hypothetical protein